MVGMWFGTRRKERICAADPKKKKREKKPEKILMLLHKEFLFTILSTDGGQGWVESSVVVANCGRDHDAILRET